MRTPTCLFWNIIKTLYVFVQSLSYYLINRDSDPITNLAGGQPESSREDGHQCHNDGGSNTQVLC